MEIAGYLLLLMFITTLGIGFTGICVMGYKWIKFLVKRWDINSDHF